MAGNRPAIAISTIEAPWAPGGKALFQMMGVFAEFERSMIQERIHAGLARARKQGKRLGRPKVSQKTERAILAARAEGKSFNKIMAELGVGKSTVQRVIAEAESAA